MWHNQNVFQNMKCITCNSSLDTGSLTLVMFAQIAMAAFPTRNCWDLIINLSDIDIGTVVR